jgi:Tol biopolymer transport system component
MYGSIWKVNVATDEAYELTHGDRLHSSPAWSPDGKWIVYTIDDNWRSIQLGILNVETGETRPLTQDDQVYVDPVFSPDGKWLAYVTTKPAGNFNVVARPIQNGDWAGPEIAVTRDHDFGRARLYFSTSNPPGSRTEADSCWFRTATWRWARGICGVFRSSPTLWRAAA